MRRTLTIGLILLLCSMAAIMSGAAAVGAHAGGRSAVLLDAQNGRAIPFSEAELFFELNDTDGDLGIHGSVDGGPWTNLEIEGPRDRKLLDIISLGSLRRQGMTQLFFESAEPSFDELDPADFFRRFPEGRYTISGRMQDGRELESVAALSHVLPNRAENIQLSGMLAPESCDVTPLPIVATPVLIDWDPVTRSHPEIGRRGPVRIVRYQLFVERQGVKLSLDLPPTVTEFEVPISITDTGDTFKFEIIARGASGNNTAVESCFRVR